jgi:solute carrier family 8 (sodium/calcium exchanger)
LVFGALCGTLSIVPVVEANFDTAQINALTGDITNLGKEISTLNSDIDALGMLNEEVQSRRLESHEAPPEEEEDEHAGHQHPPPQPGTQGSAAGGAGSGAATAAAPKKVIKKAEPLICEVGGGGLLLPLGGDGEQEWPRGLRVVLYLLGLFWSFLGVGIVADVFMGAIEAVTSKKKRAKVKGTNRYVTVKVWNDTVANLTLMALGSSAPEILLSVIELLGNEFYSGALGPSTIVGSAAFNLFCISAVCVSAIKDGIRLIKDTGVFAVTASFSVFAYVWLVVILMLITPDVVDPWEGLLTFFFFPILVILAYMADIGIFSGKKREEVVTSHVTAAEMTKEELAEMVAKIKKEYGQNLTDEQAVAVLEKQTAPPKSRAEYRVAATRAMAGGKKIETHNDEALSEVHAVEGTGDDAEELLKKKQATIEFTHEKHAVLESCPEVHLDVERKGDPSKAVTVDYKTKDGTAHAGTDYIAAEGKLEFKAGETKTHIAITIIDDAAYELDENFFVELSNPVCLDASDADAKITPVVLGHIKETTVTIIDDDEPGTLFLAKETDTVTEQITEQELIVLVERKNGSKGVVGCRYYTENDSAISPIDYEASEGELMFESGQMSAEIKINIKARGRYDGTEMFRVYIAEPSGGAKFDHTTDGGEEHCIMSIFIQADPANKQKVDALQGILNMNWDKARVGHSNYKDQFTQALYPGGGPEEAKEAGGMDKVIHLFAMPWKLLFALIPPPDYGGGWVCFIVALIFIGGVTAIIGDMAALLGCVMDVPDSITAITFVALGTSLPDTFASKTAAEQDEYADASIGNVTGSNSVNVFLGLGLPWSMGAIYWGTVDAAKKAEWAITYADTDLPGKYPNAAFAVIAGDLGFSVIVFTICACTTIGVLLLRRKLVGGELGGPNPLRNGSSAF